MFLYKTIYDIWFYRAMNRYILPPFEGAMRLVYRGPSVHMCDRSCGKCGKKFQYPSLLKAHQQRKTPCDTKVEPDSTKFMCQYCNRGFTTAVARWRHIRDNCKLATPEVPDRAEVADPPKDVVKDDTATQTRAVAQTAVANLEAVTQLGGDSQLIMVQLGTMAISGIYTADQFAEICKLAKLAMRVSPQCEDQKESNATPLALREATTTKPLKSKPKPATTKTVQNVQTVNTAIQNNIQNIIIQAAPGTIPWDDDNYISVTVASIMAAFAEVPKLREFLWLDDFQLTDVDIAPPFIVALFLELLYRAHAEPLSRNIYLNPSRSDQAMVCKKTGHWDVAPLEDSMFHLFDGIALKIHRLNLNNPERCKMPQEIQNVVSMSEMMYKDDPELYIKMAKDAIVAHLTNCRARLLESGAIAQKQHK